MRFIYVVVQIEKKTEGIIVWSAEEVSPEVGTTLGRYAGCGRFR